MTLPFDYSRCGQADCPMSKSCLRFLSPGRPGGHQVFSVFKGGPDCPDLITPQAWADRFKEPVK